MRQRLLRIGDWLSYVHIVCGTMMDASRKKGKETSCAPLLSIRKELYLMRNGHSSVCGCFPTGRHYPGIADRLGALVRIVEGLCKEWEATTPWSRIPIAIVDFETTGLDPKNDRVLEVGIVCFDGGEITSTDNWLINPGVPISEEARKVHGISDDDLANAPRFEEVAVLIAEKLRGRLPAAYNAQFDRDFLHNEFLRLAHRGETWEAPALRADSVWVDPLVWVRELHRNEKSKKLSDICALLGIPLDQAHRASTDATATGRILYKLAKDMPESYSELIRLQKRYAARQDVEAVNWKSRRNPVPTN